MKPKSNRYTQIFAQHSWLWLVIGITIILLGTAWFLRPKASAPAQETDSTTQANTAVASAIPTEVAGRYLLNGTVTWARAVERYANGNYKQPFSQLDSFQRDKYDAWSTDFECPITNNVVPYQQQVDNLVFNCRPEFLPHAAKYFNIFDLANNHTDNQGGEVGLAETRKRLDKAGAQYFGTFDPGDSDNVCEILSVPINVVRPDHADEKAALPVAFCGWHYFYRKPVASELAVMDKYAAIMPVFAFAEMGTEYQPKANATQEEIAHAIVDHEPEFLIANNPHWVQNTEVYKHKLIVYSLGNFIFDQLETETNRSGSLDVAISVPYDDNLAKWLELGPQCLKYHDDCLAEAKKQQLTKPKLSYTFGIVAGQSGAGVITHKADAATQKSVEVRMNWEQTCRELGYNACQ